MLKPWRGTQRYLPLARTDEEALTEAIIELASEYGRYGYRRITALLHPRLASRQRPRTAHLAARRIESAQKQMARGRLWLNDGSCCGCGRSERIMCGVMIS